MPRLLLKVNYTAEGAKGLLQDGGTKRKRVVSDLIKKAGGKLVSFDYAFGEHDAYLIVETPSVADATALSLSVAASGAVTIQTVVLISPEEVDEAAKKEVAYRPPGA